MSFQEQVQNIHHSQVGDTWHEIYDSLTLKGLEEFCDHSPLGVALKTNHQPLHFSKLYVIMCIYFNLFPSPFQMTNTSNSNGGARIAKLLPWFWQRHRNNTLSELPHLPTSELWSCPSWNPPPSLFVLSPTKGVAYTIDLSLSLSFSDILYYTLVYIHTYTCISYIWS